MSIAELSPEHKFKDLDVSCLSWNIICPQIPPPSHEEKWSGEPNWIFFWAGMYFATNVMYPMLSGCWEVQRVIDNLIGPYHILE